MTSVTYSRDEIISASNLPKMIKQVLNDLGSNHRKKIAISRNNNIDAVILPVEYYEELEAAYEHIEIYKTLKERSDEKWGIGLDDVIKEYEL